MPEFNVEWVGDKTHDYQDRRTYSVSLVDPAGNSHRKVKLERPQSDPAPTVGEKVVGLLNPHPRFDDAKLFAEGSQNGSSDAAGTPLTDTNTRSGDGDTYVSIEARSALHAAIESGAKPEQLRDHAFACWQIIQDIKARATGGDSPNAEAATTPSDPDSPPNPEDLF